MSLNSFNYRYSKIASKIKSILGGIFTFGVFKKNDSIARNNSLDERLVQSLSGSRIPSVRQIRYISTYLSKREHYLLNLSIFFCVATVVIFLGRFYLKHLEFVPSFGGEYVEGMVGAPKYINPLYSSINYIDSELVSLVYSSLFKRDENGRLIFDLVEKMDISADGKIYSLTIRNDAKWHTGSPVTTNDVLFTFGAIKDPQYKSPMRQAFSGVETEVIDDHNVKFILKESYAGFPELLTFGILPQELWGQLSPNAVSLAELNSKPIGSGPYRFKSLSKDKNGNLKTYNFVANSDYYLGRPYVENLIVKFYPSFEEVGMEINSNKLDGLGYFSGQADVIDDQKNYLSYNNLNTSQVKAVFLNTKDAILSDVKIRQALATAIDKKLVVESFKDEVRLVDNAILPENKYYNGDYKKYSYNKQAAQKLIEEAGWKLVDVTPADMEKAEKNKNETDAKLKKEAESYLTLGLGKWYYKGGDYLIVKLTTIDSVENVQATEAIKKNWEDLNVKTVIELAPASKIQNDVIKTRDFSALFAGEILSGDPDLFSFWHSSQIGSEGLNLSSYGSREIDQLIEEGRTNVDESKRKDIYGKILKRLADEEPAIFLYSPYYHYIQNKKVKNFNTKTIVNSSDRFSDVYKWYVETGREFNW